MTCILYIHVHELACVCMSAKLCCCCHCNVLLARLLALTAVVIVVALVIVAVAAELPLSHTQRAGLLIKSKINYSLRRRWAKADDDDSGDFALAQKKAIKQQQRKHKRLCNESSLAQSCKLSQQQQQYREYAKSSIPFWLQTAPNCFYTRYT